MLVAGFVAAWAALLLVTPACESLESFRGLSQLIQPPRFEEAPDRRHEVRLQGPTTDMPSGGLSVRLWTRITNPNPFGFTLSRLTAEFFLDSTRATTTEFPLGLPLEAGASSVVPLDLSVSFADIPALADTLRATLKGGSVPYRVEGTVGVAAGQLGTPTFGPMTILRGELRPRVN